MGLFRGAVFQHGGFPLMGRLSTLMGRFPECLNGPFSRSKIPGKQPIQKRSIKRFLGAIQARKSPLREILGPKIGDLDCRSYKTWLRVVHFCRFENLGLQNLDSGCSEGNLELPDVNAAVFAFRSQWQSEQSELFFFFGFPLT